MCSQQDRVWALLRAVGGEAEVRTSVFAPSPSWSFWNVGVPRCWSSVPAASRVAGGDISSESKRGRGRPLCSSRQVGALGTQPLFQASR